MYIMICEEILKRLEVEYPPSCAEEWDNPGLLVGRRSGEVRRIFVALDVTDETLEDAMRVTVIATGFNGDQGGVYTAAEEKAKEPAQPKDTEIDDIFRIFNRK